MLDNHKIYLYDRVKETSYTIGTQNFVLNGAVSGFSSFGSAYENGDNLFYAVTDGTFYEVGSGIYVTGIQNSLIRFPFRSSNNNQKVNFGVGLKEVFVTYPATHAVYSASGLQNHNQPSSKGIAFWSSSNILNYDSKLTWDSGNIKLGINKEIPVYTIDIGGTAPNSIIRSSGLMIGASGISFPYANNGDSEYQGGIQLTHYEANELISDTDIDNVLELSGVAQNKFLLRKQNAGLVFAGPASGCTPPCSPDYPVFRPLILKDIYELDGFVADEEGFRFNKPVAINTLSRQSSKLFIYNDVNNNENAAWFSSIATSTSSSIKSTCNSLVASSTHVVNSGVTSSGTMAAATLFSLRNSVSGDVGTLSGIYALYIGYGNEGKFAQNPVTNNAYGIFVAPFDGSGTLNTAYDIYLEDAVINSGIINKHYGLYQNGQHKSNVFEGKVGIKSDLLRGSVNSFQNFNPTVSGGWLEAAYTSSGIYGGGLSLLDTVDTNPSGQHGYTIYTSEAGINLNFAMANKNGLISDIFMLLVGERNEPTDLNQAKAVFRGNSLVIQSQKTPTSASGNGLTGQICWDNNYVYVCVAPNTWKRTFLSTW